MSTTHEVADPYLEERGGGLYVRGSRVPLESLVWPWRDGHSAEEIQDSYPTVAKIWNYPEQERTIHTIAGKQL